MKHKLFVLITLALVSTMTLNAQQLNVLDVKDNFTATVRCADFYLGFSGRRGTPGRALVDATTNLYLNYGADWDNTIIGGNTTRVQGALATTGALTVGDNFTTTIGCADFRIGFSARRGTPGRALVDATDDLWVNFGADWSRTIVGGNSVYIPNSLGIGAASVDGYKLAVNGKILAKEVKVSANWADFVFEDDYKLRSLPEVEKFIQTNKHLPEIPSAKEVEKNGVDVGNMESKLLQKIEELTLYTIDQDKQIKNLRDVVKTQQKQIEILINALKENK